MMGHRNDGILKVEVTGVKPSPFQCILLPKSAYCQLSLALQQVSIMITMHTLH